MVGHLLIEGISVVVAMIVVVSKNLSMPFEEWRLNLEQGVIDA